MQGELQHGLAVCEAEVLSFIEPLEQVGGGLAAPSESDREPGAGVSDRCGVHAQDRTGQDRTGRGRGRRIAVILLLPPRLLTGSAPSLAVAPRPTETDWTFPPPTTCAPCS